MVVGVEGVGVEFVFFVGLLLYRGVDLWVLVVVCVG